jgi:hypothetical protein
MGVDQAGNDPAAGEIQLRRLLGKFEPRAGTDRFYVTAPNNQSGIPQRWTAASVDQRGAQECDSVRLTPAAGSQADQQQTKDYPTGDHWMSGRV